MSAGPDRMKTLIAAVASGAPLTGRRRAEAFEIMMSGDATPAQVGGFLMALRVRGETVDELTGGAAVLRGRMVKVAAPDDAIDTCGTGGDASGTFNVSTAAAIVVAACGVPVAKHGNRALSSRVRLGRRSDRARGQHRDRAGAGRAGDPRAPGSAS